MIRISRLRARVHVSLPGRSEAFLIASSVLSFDPYSVRYTNRTGTVRRSSSIAIEISLWCP